MYLKLFIFFIIIFVSMANSQSNRKMEELLWIVDNWVNAEGETVSYEHWEKVNDSLYEGGSETIKNGDTVFSEKLKILKENDDIFYVADVKHNPAPVYFKLTYSGTNKAVFENPEHDFPRKITYEIENGNLHAYIEGPSKKGSWKKVDFYFTRRR
jgi:hypothetical protein